MFKKTIYVKIEKQDKHDLYLAADGYADFG